MAIQVEKQSETQRIVWVVAKVDIGKLPFARQNDRHIQQLTCVAAFLDGQGRMVTARESRLDLALKQDTYERMAKTGVNAELSFLVAPGVFKLRAVLGEAVNGTGAASTYPIQVK